MAIKICRIDRICDTSNKSVRIDERIRKVLTGNADEFDFSLVVDVGSSLPILLIVARSNAETTGCLIIPATDGKSEVCLISEENSSRRVPI